MVFESSITITLTLFGLAISATPLFSSGTT
jgi:hypothetical protein